MEDIIVASMRFRNTLAMVFPYQKPPKNKKIIFEFMLHFLALIQLLLVLRYFQPR